MRAAWYERQGEAADVLQVGSSTSRRRAGRGSGAGRCFGGQSVGHVQRAGGAAPMAFPRVIPHQDGAGVIEAVGQGVPAERVGERVWVYEATWNRPGGTAADSRCARRARRSLARPDRLRRRRVSGYSRPDRASSRLRRRPGHRPDRAGDRRRRRGRHGGGAASQVGRRNRLATVSSDAKAAVARDAGADHIINYKTHDVVADVRRLTGDAGVDRIVDVDFGGNLPTSLQILKPTAPSPATPRAATRSRRSRSAR